MLNGLSADVVAAIVKKVPPYDLGTALAELKPAEFEQVIAVATKWRRLPPRFAAPSVTKELRATLKRSPGQNAEEIMP
jgi:hypothetical protein